MTHPLPAHLHLTTTFTWEVEGIPIDFTIHYTLFGEVLQVDNHFAQLPKMAQQFMLGKAPEKALNYIHYFVEALRFYVPLAALGYLKEGEWAKIYNAVEDLKKQYPETAEINMLANVKDKWLKVIWKMQRRNPYPIDFTNLINILNQKSIQPFSKRTRRQPFLSFSLKWRIETWWWEELLIIYANILNKNVNTIAILNLLKNTFHTEKTLQFFIDFVNDDSKQGFHKECWSAFKNYKDDRIKNLLLNYYKKFPTRKTTYIESFYEVLAIYEGEKVKEIFLKSLIIGSKYIQDIAYLKLRKIQVPEEEIIKEAISFFHFFGRDYSLKRYNQTLNTSYSKSNIAKLKLTISLFQKIQNIELLPTSQELVSALKWSSLSLRQYIPISLIEKRKTKDTLPQLRFLLEDKETIVQKAGLSALSELGGEEDISLLLSKIDSINANMQTAYLQTIFKLIQVFPYKKHLPQLMDKCGMLHPSSLEILLNCIKHITKYNSLIPDEIAPMTQQLHHKDPLIRSKTLSILDNGFRTNFYNEILKLTRDSDKKVREHAQQICNTILKTRLDTALNKERPNEVYKELLNIAQLQDKYLFDEALARVEKYPNSGVTWVLIKLYWKLEDNALKISILKTLFKNPNEAAIQHFKALFEKKEPFEVMDKLIVSLAKSSIPEATSILKAALHLPDPAIRAHTVYALLWHASKHIIIDMEFVVKKALNDPDLKVRLKVILPLANYRSKEKSIRYAAINEAFQKMTTWVLSNSHPKVRLEGMTIIQRMCQNRVKPSQMEINAVLDCFRDEDKKVRREATEMLRRISELE